MGRVLQASGGVLAVALGLWGLLPLWGGIEAARVTGSLGPLGVALVVSALWWAAAGFIGGVVAVATRLETRLASLHAGMAALHGRRMRAGVAGDIGDGASG